MSFAGGRGGWLVGLFGGCWVWRRGGGGGLRRTEKPTAVPRAMGTRIESAGWANSCPGRVREGM